MTQLMRLILAFVPVVLPLSCAAPDGGPATGSAGSAGSAAAAQAGFERMAALEGEWTGEGPADAPGPMTVTYELTGGGSALVETLFANSPGEMVTIYTIEEGALMLTHYCALGNQPRMRADPLQGDVLVFRFAGGANIDPARDDHMHDARYEFVAQDELLIEFTGWTGGRPDSAHQARVHLKRKS